METSQFIIEGYCQGAYPVDDDNLNEILEEPWYKELIDAIRAGDAHSALSVAKENFKAEYNTESIYQFESNGIRYVKTLSTNLNLPFIESNGSADMPLFKWIGAHFLMEGPTDIVSQWIETDEDGMKYFSQEMFEDWFGNDDRLQDGCYYALGSCWYDLEGFGENGGSINASSVVAGLGRELEISEDQLLSNADKIKKKKEEILGRLPSEKPMKGDDLITIYELLEDESPAAERRADRYDCIDKWAKLAGYKDSASFLEAVLAL